MITWQLMFMYYAEIVDDIMGQFHVDAGFHDLIWYE